MKFTIVFPSHESRDLSIGAVFIPCLVWMIGEGEIFNPPPENSKYLRRDLTRLLEETSLRNEIADFTHKVAVVAHSTEHGTEKYLDDLVVDLKKEGFEAEVVHQ